MRVLSIGEVLWDHCDTVSTLGGAPLNVSAHLAFMGHSSAILSSVGQDEWGFKAWERIRSLGIDDRFLQRTGSAPTGSSYVSLNIPEEPASVIHHPAAYENTCCTPAILREICGFAPDWIYIGTLFHMPGHLLEQTSDLCQGLRNTSVFYDVNLRPDNWNLGLVERLSQRADIVKMNESEARTLAHLIGMESKHPSWLPTFSKTWVKRFELECLCVTLGTKGCGIFTGSSVHMVPCVPTETVDALGAGDAFCAGFLHGWQKGWNVEQAARLGNLLGGMVAGKHGAIPEWSAEERLRLQQQLDTPLSTVLSV